MKIVIDTDNKTLEYSAQDGAIIQLDLYSKRAFEILSNEWLRVGWNQKYQYSFSWLGRPIIQLPEDLLRIQEVIYRLKPDVIVETGIAHGGSLIFYAGLCKIIGKGRVVGIDIDIRAHNRKAIEEHELFDNIKLVEGGSTEPDIVNAVNSMIKPEETVLVILDSNHTKKHVLEELNLYSKLVSVGSYIVATDGIMKDLYDVPRGEPGWIKDNPTAAAIEFSSKNNDFVIEQPAWTFNESELTDNITHWPQAWLKRI